MLELIAIILYKIGLKPHMSYSIADEFTYGYGKLDDNGFWQLQIPKKYINQLKDK